MFNSELDVGPWSTQQLHILCPQNIGYLMVEGGEGMLIRFIHNRIRQSNLRPYNTECNKNAKK